MENNKKSILGIGNLDKASLKKKAPKALPKTVQQSIPYIEAYENGVMQVEPCVFSRIFEFQDISFNTCSDEEQEQIYTNYQRFLNTLSPKEDVWFYFVNMSEDTRNKLEHVCPLTRGDQDDIYRKEMTDMLQDKISSMRNSIETKKYILITVEEETVSKAMDRIMQLSTEIENQFKRVVNTGFKALSLAERLELMSVIMNSKEKNYWFEHDSNGNTSVDFTKMAKYGLTTKDIIAPTGMRFNGNYFEIGERYGQAMFLEQIANWMNTNFLSDLTSTNFECVVSMSIKAIPTSEALKLIHRQSVAITAEIMDKQKSAMKEMINPEFISVDLKNAKAQIDALQEDMTNRDQKLFYSAISLIHFAEDKEALTKQSKIIRDVGSKYMCQIRPLSMKQERGFVTCMPMGINRLGTAVDRLLPTESLAVFLPLNEMNKFDEGGFYYGVNAINKSLIIHNRKKGMNYNGLILGSSGSGKSFSAKREIVSAYLNTDATIYIIDPDGEYTALAQKFHGQVIKITPSGLANINPLDLDIDTSADGDLNPVAMKCDFISGILETMLGHGAKLYPVQKSIVDRCVNQIYRPYLEHLQSLPAGPNGIKPTIDKAACPTLVNLFECLINQPQPEAQQLALALETYAVGSYDTFAKKTNVDTNNRLIVYNIQDIGSHLKEIGLKVCINDIWTKMIENKRKGKWTYMYVDEFHLLLSNPSTSEFVKSIWKRCRKFQGVPTGITQNVEDLLLSPDARAIINNSSFVYMLNQSAMDRSALAEILHLSENDIRFITNVEPGHGLIYDGIHTIPFEDNFPTNTELFKIMTTKSFE